ncbi:MAG: class I SAM-dependent methyltransferase [Thermomicrobiales bacterium]
MVRERWPGRPPGVRCCQAGCRGGGEVAATIAASPSARRGDALLGGAWGGYSGADISDEQIAIARRKATEAGLTVAFVAAMRCPRSNSDFDIVYTGGGRSSGCRTSRGGRGSWRRRCARARAVDALRGASGRGLPWVEQGKLVITEDYWRGKTAPDQGWGHFGGEECRRRSTSSPGRSVTW